MHNYGPIETFRNRAQRSDALMTRSIAGRSLLKGNAPSTGEDQNYILHTRNITTSGAARTNWRYRQLEVNAGILTSDLVRSISLLNYISKS